MISTPPTMAGLFFCLASAEGAGLLFCPDAIQPHTSVYGAFCTVNAIIQPTPKNSVQGFTAAFPVIIHVQSPTILDRHNRPLHHLRHAGGHTRARTLSAYTRYHRHAGTLHRSVQAAYYNKVYKRVRLAVDPCQTVQHITDHASPAGQSSGGGAAGGAEPLAVTAASLFGLSPDSQ